MSSLSNITSLLERILENQETLNKRLTNIEHQLNTHQKKTIKIKKKQNVFDFKNSDLIPITNNHLEIAFFSSLEFAFLIVLLESIASLCDYSDIPTSSVYDEVSHCDSHFQIEIKQQLITLSDKLHSYKTIFPFKYLNNYDGDKSNLKGVHISKLRCYYENEWGSFSFKKHFTTLYKRFSNSLIKQFSQWQNEYEEDIETDKSYKGMTYTECVLKIVGADIDSNTSLNTVFNYLCQIC